MPKRTRNYEESLLADLRDPAEAAAYLNAALEEIDAEDGMALFLMSLGDVLRAQGVSNVARSAELGRESLYKSLSATGNPKFKSLLAVLRGMGLGISIQATPRVGAKPPSPGTRRKPALAKAS